MTSSERLIAMSLESEHKLKQQDVGGLKINYFEDGTGPNLVLLHGMFGDHLDWAPVLEPLASKFHVVAPDLPGFGRSDKPDVDYSGKFFVDSLHRLFDSAGLTDLTLAGNSFGGQIALLYTLCHPARVSNLVLVNSGGFREVTEADRAMARAMLSQDDLLAMPPAMASLLFARVFVKEIPEKQRYIAKQMAKLKEPDYPEYVRALVRSMDLSMATNLLEELSRIKCPVLILSGTEDTLVPTEQAREAARRLPRATLQIMEGSGHVPQLEEPQEFVRLVTDHIFKKP